MAHKVKKCVKSPACAIAMAGGKKHASKKHALLVASFAKRQNQSFEAAASLIKRGVDALLGGMPPKSLDEFAATLSAPVEVAADLLDALTAFGYIKA